MKRMILGMLLLTSSGGFTACSAKSKKVLIASAIGGAAGAGLGYAVVHNGSRQQYRTQNTIISASILAAIFGLATWYHLSELDEQKIDLAGQFSRATYLDRGIKADGDHKNFSPILLQKESIRLDTETRWVLPEFQRRFLPPERSETELIVSHHAWEVIRPGFFVTRDQDPDLFKLEDKK